MFHIADPKDIKSRPSSLPSSPTKKSNPRYDCMLNEQVEIDRLVYQIYNHDIKEVESWLFHRYPRFVRVIERKRNNKNALISES